MSDQEAKVEDQPTRHGRAATRDAQPASQAAEAKAETKSRRRRPPTKPTTKKPSRRRKARPTPSRPANRKSTSCWWRHRLPVRRVLSLAFAGHRSGGRDRLSLRQRAVRAERARRAGRRRPVCRDSHAASAAPLAHEAAGAHRRRPYQGRQGPREIPEGLRKRPASRPRRSSTRISRSCRIAKASTSSRRRPTSWPPSSTVSGNWTSSWKCSRTNATEALKSAQRDLDQTVHAVQDRYKLWAVLLPPIPPLIVD